MQNYILSALLLAFITACYPKKETSNSTTPGKCDTMATVKDFTGLDGCKLLIVLDNGDKLLPAKVNDKSFTLKDGQRIKLGYKKIDGMASICMAEKMSIEVTCIELVSEDIPAKPECFETKNPMSVGWMKAKVRDLAPSQIIRYDFLDGWAYLYKTDSKRNYVYDCQGNLLCEIETDIRQCKRQMNDPDAGMLIYDRDRIPIKPECFETTSPASIPWMKQRMDQHQPAQIVRYDFLDGWAYFYKTDNKRSYIYDCQGNLLCEVETSVRQCKRQMNDPNAGLVIFDRNNIPIKPTCYQTTDPQGITWMRYKIGHHQPVQILRYDFLDGWAYFYKTAGKRSYLYDCQGNLICEVETSIRQCKRQVENPDQGMVIYEKDSKPLKPTCYQTMQAVEVEWMRNSIFTHKAEQVLRYDYLDGWAYFFKTSGKRSYVYDCQGNLICEVETDIRQCKRSVKNPGQGLVVYQGVR